MKGYYDSERKNYKFHCTTMDYLQHSINQHRHSWSATNIIPFAELLKPKDEYACNSVKYSQVSRILGLVRDMRNQIKSVWDNTEDGLDNSDKIAITSDIRLECINYIKNIELNQNTAYRLLLALDDQGNKDISRSLFYALFSLPNKLFLNLIDESRTPIYTLEENEAGEIEIYGVRYKKSLNNANSVSQIV